MVQASMELNQNVLECQTNVANPAYGLNFQLC